MPIANRSRLHKIGGPSSRGSPVAEAMCSVVPQEDIVGRTLLTEWEQSTDVLYAWHVSSRQSMQLACRHHPLSIGEGRLGACREVMCAWGKDDCQCRKIWHEVAHDVAAVRKEAGYCRAGRGWQGTLYTGPQCHKPSSHSKSGWSFSHINQPN